MSRQRNPQSKQAEQARLHRPTTQTMLHRVSARIGYRKSDFYRHARHVHAWISAFAFLALMFFAGTGLLLNHPDWFAGKAPEQSIQLTLPHDVLAQAKALENPAPLLLAAIRQQPLAAGLRGAFKSSDRMGDEIDMRLEGAKGHSTISVMLDNGQTEITLSPATTLNTLENLHKGKNVSDLWHLVIDICAILIMTLSLAGYVLFFSLRKRKAISLWLTALCLATLVSIFIWGVV
jgi:hypothetical protein